MKRTRTIAAMIATLTLVLAGCGDSAGSTSTSDEEPCGVNAYGNELCGGSAAAYCDMIDGTQSSDPGTRDFCAKLDAGYD